MSKTQKRQLLQHHHRAILKKDRLSDNLHKKTRSLTNTVTVGLSNKIERGSGHKNCMPQKTKPDPMSKTQRRKLSWKLLQHLLHKAIFQQNRFSDNHKKLFRLQLQKGEDKIFPTKLFVKENVSSTIEISNFSGVDLSIWQCKFICNFFVSVGIISLKFEISIAEFTFSLAKSFVGKMSVFRHSAVIFETVSCGCLSSYSAEIQPDEDNAE